MTSRQAEQDMLNQCAAVAHATVLVAADQKEANIFRVAAMVVQSRFPLEAARLSAASESYLSLNPNEQLPAGEVASRGWILSLPRLKDALTSRLAR